MRSIRRKRPEEDEEESAFVPMTDMTVSFLFIVMILLAFFAVQFSDEDNVPRSVYEEVVVERNDLIKTVKDLRLEIDRLNVIIKELKLKNEQLKEKNIELNDENNRLRDQLDNALKLISKLENELIELKNKNLNLNKTVFFLSMELGEVKRLLSQKNQRIIHLEDMVKSLETKLTIANGEILKLKLDIKKFKDRINEMYAEIQTLLSTIKFKDELIQSRDVVIASMWRAIDELSEQIVDKDKTILNLKAELEELKQRLKYDPFEAYFIESQIKRSEILSEIEKKLKIEFPDILVEISPENDALRFKGDGLFTSGSSQLSASKRKIVEKVGILIADAIECFTINKNQPDYKVCNPDGILIEAVQIEGHTDNSRFVGADGRDKNIELSAKRATSAFFAMKDAKPDLLTFENLKGQPVISIAGYGDMRPVNLDSDLKAENRRIDLRLIMFSPTSRSQVNSIQTSINSDLKIILEEAE